MEFSSTCVYKVRNLDRIITQKKEVNLKSLIRFYIQIDQKKTNLKSYKANKQRAIKTDSIILDGKLVILQVNNTHIQRTQANK